MGKIERKNARENARKRARKDRNKGLLKKEKVIQPSRKNVKKSRTARDRTFAFFTFCAMSRSLSLLSIHVVSLCCSSFLSFSGTFATTSEMLALKRCGETDRKKENKIKKWRGNSSERERRKTTEDIIGKRAKEVNSKYSRYWKQDATEECVLNGKE